MSTSFSNTPNALRVAIKPSKYFYGALLVIASMASAAVFYAQLTWPWRTLALALIGIYTGYCWRLQRTQRGELVWGSVWSWIDSSDSKRVLTLRHSTVWPAFIALRFYDEQRQRHINFSLLPDSFPLLDESRRLRVHLRHFPVFDAAEVQ